MDNSGGLKVNVFKINSGLKTYDEVSYVRITSSDYNLLIMVDYMPIIGEIKGKVDINTPEGEIKFENIKASFMNSNNVFNLMIQGYIND